MKKNIAKIALSVFLAASTVFSQVHTPTLISAASATSDNLLYEDKDIQTITKGVTYEKSSRLYKDGWMDVYVLQIDMTNSNAALDVIQSATEFGLKKSVESFAKENNVIAAVNGDFFGSGNPQSSMGQVFSEGKIEQAQNYYNSSNNKYAGFFVDGDNVPFIDYVKTQFGFFNSSNPVIEIGAKNKYNGFKTPVYFDRQAITSTKTLDNRVSGLVKIVVTDGVITKISSAGEVVDVPENGYIIVMRKDTADDKIEYFSVGQKVSFNETGQFLFRPAKNVSEISFGISGGGEILRNGQIIANGLIIGQNGRNPRTLVGVNKEKTKVIIMAIDGRKNGIGATHNEAARLLLEYGAYDAIHLDGGGSTTVAVKKEDTNNITIENVPSEGSQRLVANALAIKAVNGPTGVVSELKVFGTDNNDNIFLKNAPGSLSIKGYDEYHNLLDVNPDTVTYAVTEGSGEINGNILTPYETGDIKIAAYIDGVEMGVMEGKVLSAPVAINVQAQKTYLDIGESTYLNAKLVNKDGFEAPVSYTDINWSIDDETIGFVENGKFTASGNGTAKLTALYGDYSSSIDISVGKVMNKVESFENDRPLKFITYPPETGITGGTGRTNTGNYSGTNSLMLNYGFIENATTTQVVYASFSDSPISLGEAANIGLWLKGDGNGCLLKALLKDANNTEYTVTLSENIDFTDWQYLQAEIPETVAYPVVLDKIYTAALTTTTPLKGSLLIDDITVLAPMTKAQNYTTQFRDYQRVDLSNAPQAGEEDITVFGQTEKKYGENIAAVENNVMLKMQQNARAMYFVGDSLLNSQPSVPTVQWNNKYNTTNTSNVSIISIASKGGVIRKENDDQWRWFQSYLKDFSKNNIIIGIDKDIWGRSGNNLTDVREREMFHKILKDFVRETDKNVIVVQATGYSTGVNVQDGVRYITLNGLSSQNSAELSSFKYLRIRAGADTMYYDIQNVY